MLSLTVTALRRFLCGFRAGKGKGRGKREKVGEGGREDRPIVISESQSLSLLATTNSFLFNRGFVPGAPKQHGDKQINE